MLEVNCRASPIKGHRQSDWIKKQNSTIFSCKEHNFSTKKHVNWKRKDRKQHSMQLSLKASSRSYVNFRKWTSSQNWPESQRMSWDIDKEKNSTGIYIHIYIHQIKISLCKRTDRHQFQFNHSRGLQYPIFTNRSSK